MVGALRTHDRFHLGSPHLPFLPQHSEPFRWLEEGSDPLQKLETRQEDEVVPVAQCRDPPNGIGDLPVVALAMGIPGGDLRYHQELAPLVREGGLEFRRSDGFRVQSGEPRVVVEGLQRGREPHHLPVFAVAILKHCRGIAAGDLHRAPGRMGVIRGEELLPVGVDDILEGLRECGPGEGEPEDHVLVPYLHAGFEVPGEEGAKPRILLEKTLHGGLDPHRLRGVALRQETTTRMQPSRSSSASRRKGEGSARIPSRIFARTTDESAGE